MQNRFLAFVHFWVVVYMVIKKQQYLLCHYIYANLFCELTFCPCLNTLSYFSCEYRLSVCL